MSTHVLDRIEEWDARPFTGGYRGLQGFADQSFSGVVRADGVELFMTRGVAVAVRGGGIEAFEDASGTAYDAPSPALPLLAVMQEQSNEVRDRFYTEQTPISSVDETLSAGGFTGYIELSENVLSGDYYLVYHAGESASVAFVGQSGRLVRGAEAFESADNEVGIYRVRPVEIHPVEVPEPEPTDPSDPSADTGSPAGVDDTGAGPDREETGSAAAESGPASGEPERPEPTRGSARTAVESVESTDGSVRTESPEAGSESAEMEAKPGPAGSGHTEDGPSQQSVESAATSVETDEASTPIETGTDDPGGDTDSGVRVIPSVDPTLTADNGTDDTPAEPSTDTPATPEASSSDKSTEGSDESNPTPGESDSGDGADVTIDPEVVEQLEQRLDSLEDECEALRERLDEVQAERDELRDQLTDIRAEHDEG